MRETVTAIEMAKSKGVDAKQFRKALRAANLAWHAHNERWIVTVGSSEHSDMKQVLSRLIRK